MEKIGDDEFSLILIPINVDDTKKFYIEILQSNIKGDFKFLRCGDNIIKGYKTLGIKDHDINEMPKVGNIFRLHSWETSKVIEVLNDSIFITQNSVYVIHNKHLMRKLKLEKLLECYSR